MDGIGVPGFGIPFWGTNIQDYNILGYILGTVYPGLEASRGIHVMKN